MARGRDKARRRGATWQRLLLPGADLSCKLKVLLRPPSPLTPNIIFTLFICNLHTRTHTHMRTHAHTRSHLPRNKFDISSQLFLCHFDFLCILVKKFPLPLCLSLFLSLSLLSFGLCSICVRVCVCVCPSLPPFLLSLFLCTRRIFICSNSDLRGLCILESDVI